MPIFCIELAAAKYRVLDLGLINGSLRNFGLQYFKASYDGLNEFPDRAAWQQTTKDDAMNCCKCGHEEVQRHVGIHELDLAALPYPVVLVGIPITRCPACGEEVVTIPDPEGLHRLLALTIVAAGRPVLPEEIRFLRKLVDRSAKDMAALIGVDPKTLSRWENGHQKMGTVAERLLRLLIHRKLAPGASMFAEEVFPRLRDRGDAVAMKFRASAAGWQRAV